MTRGVIAAMEFGDDGYIRVGLTPDPDAENNLGRDDLDEIFTWAFPSSKHVTNGKEHDYYPDFVVDGTIVEVKGQRWIDVSPPTWQAKLEALASWCVANQRSYRVVLDGDLRAYSKRANAYHETQKQDCCSVQG